MCVCAGVRRDPSLSASGVKWGSGVLKCVVCIVGDAGVLRWFGSHMLCTLADAVCCGLVLHCGTCARTRTRARTHGYKPQHTFSQPELLQSLGMVDFDEENRSRVKNMQGIYESASVFSCSKISRGTRPAAKNRKGVRRETKYGYYYM